MSIAKHRTAVLDSVTPGQFLDKLIIGQALGVANVIGGGAGAAVVTAVGAAQFPEGLPANYQVIVTVGQDAVAFVTAKTTTGFNVTLEPRLAANTLAAGTFDVLVIAA